MSTVIAILIIVAALYWIAKWTQKEETKKKDAMLAYQIANNLRIVMESAQIARDTKNYDVKVSRSKLLFETLDKLASSKTAHIVHDETLTQTLSEINKYTGQINHLSQKHEQVMWHLKALRDYMTCPYCKAEAFEWGSRATKCKECGKKNARIKVGKKDHIRISQEENEQLKEIEASIIELPLTADISRITVSEDVMQQIRMMEEKLLQMSGK